MEQEKNEVIPAQEGDKKTETSYGKFNSAEDLLKAYTALESEFTKRSQKLKELENKVGIEEKKEGVDALLKKYPVAEEFKQELQEEIAKTAGAEKSYEGALLNVLSRKVMSADEMAQDERVIKKVLSDEDNREMVISSYLDKIRNDSGYRSLPKGGAIPVAPSYRAKSVKEAGEIAKKILERME